MSRETRSPWRSGRSRVTGFLPALLALLAVVALVSAARAPRDAAATSGDEAHYLTAAASLLRDGSLDFGRHGAAYREPGYAAAIALAWRASGVSPPAPAPVAAATAPATAPAPDPSPSPSETDEIRDLPTHSARWRPIRALHLVALAVAAFATGLAVARLEGPNAGAIAALLVAASPALRHAGAYVQSENLAAAALSLFACGLVLLRTGSERAGTALVAAVATLLPLVRAETVLLLPLAAVAIARGDVPARPRRRVARFATALFVLALPALAWVARNEARTGHALLADRGGLALAVRAALDRDVARFGARVALLSFTPSARARAAATALEPESTLLDHRPAGSENFFLRTLRTFEAEVEAEGGDLAAVDRRFGRSALRSWAARPVEHALTAVVVGWRSLFAERSPGWAHPFDLALPLGVGLGFGALAILLFAISEGDTARLAFVAPGALLVGFHLAATEFLPRYALPLLPALWGTAVLFGCRLRRQLAGDPAIPTARRKPAPTES